MRVISGLCAAGLIAAAALVGALAGTEADAAPLKTSIALVAYSTPKEAYGKIIEAFGKTTAGKNASFTQSYSGSAEQAAAVIAGLPADVVALSLEPDITTLVNKGKVPKNWKRGKYGGMATDSIVVFVVRDGNPEKIRTWADLVKPGIEVITPNPVTSGGARWNVMAAYGAIRKQGKSHKQGVAYLRQFFRHVPVMAASAREALQTFATGKGDVLITYENEAIFATRKGTRTDFVRPRETILIENPVALTKTGARKKEAKAFVNYLRSPTAQRIYAVNGYRPVVKSVLRQTSYPNPKGMFKIGYVGGWAKVQKQFFAPRTGIVTRIVSGLGK
jgi:sulfate/thiosulfate-binding protein